LDFTIDQIEPGVECGPDFTASRDGHAVAVEVTRFRSNPCHPGPSRIEWGPYGNPERDEKRAHKKIVQKQRQADMLRADECVVALWNDDEDMEETEVEEAVRFWRNEARRTQRPTTLGFVVYGSGWRRLSGSQLHVFPAVPCPHDEVWMRDFERGTPLDTIVLDGIRRLQR